MNDENLWIHFLSFEGAHIDIFGFISYTGDLVIIFYFDEYILTFLFINKYICTTCVRSNKMLIMYIVIFIRFDMLLVYFLH